MDGDFASYDSAQDARAHIARVRVLLDVLVSALRQRGIDHDASKFHPEEKELVDREMPYLRTLAFGSPEYWEARERLRPAIDHHNRLNSHHPEHYPDGIAGMDLLDVVEMFVDWKAASERQSDPDFARSLAVCLERFKIDPQLASILHNTARRLGWI